jgi:hypothetical protein
MSKARQGDEHLLVRSYAVTHPPDLHLSKRAYPDWDQLAYASHGVMTVETEEGAWGHAYTAPCGFHKATFGVRMSDASPCGRSSSEARMRRGPAGELRRGRAPLMRELVLHAPRRARCAAAATPGRSPSRAPSLLDQLAGCRVEPLLLRCLPIPGPPRRGRAALRIGGRRVARVSRVAGASQRTLERLFLEGRP